MPQDKNSYYQRFLSTNLVKHQSEKTRFEIIRKTKKYK